SKRGSGLAATSDSHADQTQAEQGERGRLRHVRRAAAADARHHFDVVDGDAAAEAEALARGVAQAFEYQRHHVGEDRGQGEVFEVDHAADTVSGDAVERQVQASSAAVEPGADDAQELRVRTIAAGVRVEL